jgi:hypothetical protein
LIKGDAEELGVLINTLVRGDGYLNENRRWSSAEHNKLDYNIQWGCDHKIGAWEAQQEENVDCRDADEVESRRIWHENIRKSLCNQETGKPRARAVRRDREH